MAKIYAQIIIGSLFIMAVMAIPVFGAVECSQCHGAWIDKVSSDSILHTPFISGECMGCHLEHGESNELILVLEGTTLCLKCHDTHGRELRTHLPGKNACLPCHDPHSSDEKSLTVKPFEELCMLCHENIVKASYVHQAITYKGCRECHTPHISDTEKMLKAKSDQLCSGCHSVLSEEERPHSALHKRRCVSCHDPHSSTLYRLLKQEYRSDFFPGSYEEEKYSLCFSCHDSFLVTGKDPSDTGFRDGSVNLHTVHVLGKVRFTGEGLTVKGKSRSCANCHDPHGSVQPFSLKRYFECTEIMCRTITFFPEPGGGRCLTACHGRASYARQ